MAFQHHDATSTPNTIDTSDLLVLCWSMWPYLLLLAKFPTTMKALQQAAYLLNNTFVRLKHAVAPQ